MSGELIRFELDLALDSTPISGWLAPAGAEQVRFTGYTGLIAALEGARESQVSEPASEADPGSTPEDPR